MGARAIEDLEGAKIKTYVVAAGQTVTRGFGVKLSSGKILNGAAVGDDCFAIALEDGVAGQSVQVALFGFGVAKVKVGSTGLAEGAFVKFSASGGITGTVGGGTTKIVFWGQALEAGVSGDLVGCNLGVAGPNVGS